MKSRTENFRGQLAEAQGDQRATWRVANRQLHSKPPTYHSDDDCARLSTTFGQFFKDKLNRISDTIAANLSSSSATAQHTAARTYSGPMFDGFRAVNVTDVQRLLIKMPAKSSPLDVVPTSLLKSCVDIFAVMITRLANLSFHEGQFPSCFKTAQVLPLLKKAGADRADPANYRPISNLWTISKVLERLALMQLRPHLLSSNNFCPFQSGYRTGHSTETALLELLNDVYLSAYL